MKFKVSSGLKSIIGKDLITDDYVAIFELVKNSFDAYADRVDLVFEDNAMYVIDNGKGMSKDDFINKWLFVAYSAKLDNTENSKLHSDYRKKLRAARKNFAGNKGIGRFSCDRLGRMLQIQSRSNDEKEVNCLEVDWLKFEDNNAVEFGDVELNFERGKDFELPKVVQDICNDFKSGTILKIFELRDSSSWNRKKLLSLKSSIAKLIDPFGVRDDFSVYLHSSENLIEDEKELSKFQGQLDIGIDVDSPYVEIVNGKVKNFIFDKLSNKTTKIKTYLSDNKECIFTELIDRGELVYRIKEPNNYSEIFDSHISVELYYMNTKAKINFTRHMGIECTNFGSVFLFNNGFRVYPIGEKNDDTLGLNTRKAQGYSRYLGTRELLGLIDIKGNPEKFKESSSRDQGLIRTRAYRQLYDLFMDKSLKRLEAYVVNVSWPDKLDGETEDLSRILTDSGKGKVVSVIAKLVAGKNIELLEYSERLIDIVSERNSSFETTVKSLQSFVNSTGKEELQSKIDLALNRYNELKKAEKESRREAEKERLAREEAENLALEQMEKLEESKESEKQLENALDEEKRSNLFLRRVTSADLKSILNFNHQIGIYSSDINHLIQFRLDSIKSEKTISVSDYKNLLETISFKNQQILTISRVSTVADFRMSTEVIEEDLLFFLEQYIENVASNYHPDIDIFCKNHGSKWKMEFRPLELMIVVDNLIHNSTKDNSASSRITFEPKIVKKNRLEIQVFDDGHGFDKRLKSDIASIFELGVSTTDGSGIGLYHVQQVIEGIGGSIEADLSFNSGAKFIIRFAK